MNIGKINQALERYQLELSELENGENLISGLALSIREIVAETIAKANQTESIDERMGGLVQGLQSILVNVNSSQEKFLRDKTILQIKIETLEDLLLDDLVEVTDSDAEQ